MKCRWTALVALASVVCVSPAVARPAGEIAIIDITGVPVVDTAVAEYLIQAARAASLMGCRSLLVGIRPEIAQVIVELGIDMSGFLRCHREVQEILPRRGSDRSHCSEDSHQPGRYPEVRRQDALYRL